MRAPGLPPASRPSTHPIPTMAINLNDFAQAAEGGGKIRLQADAPDKVKSSSQSLWRRLRGANSEEKTENRAVRAAFLDALKDKYGKAFADSVASQVDVNSPRSLSAKDVRALIQAGERDLQARQENKAREVADHRAALPGLSTETSITGKSAASLVADLDAQNAKLEALQKQDQARLDALPDGPAREGIRDQMNDRAETIEKNNQFIERLYQGEHPTLVQYDMVKERSMLPMAGERKQLDEAYEELITRAQNVDQQAALDAILNQPFAPLSHPPPKVLPPLPGEQPAALDAILNQPFAPLSHPPPKVLPPLPGEKPAALQRNNSVRDMLKNQGAVANNPFKVQDNAVKAGQQADPEALQQDGDAMHQSTGKALGSSPKPQAPAPKPGAKKLGGL